VIKSQQSKQTLLASARKRKGWTQAYVAQRVNVSTDAVRQWERGRHLPYQATIQQLCELFQMTPKELGLLKEQAPVLAPKKEEIFTCANEIKTQRTPDQMLLQETSTNGLPPSERMQEIREPGEEEKKAAWELYVELVTRVSVATLSPDDGILREALSSLYSLFQTTRTILRDHGPAIAPDENDNRQSVSHIVVRMVNTIVRPFLAKWHPLLKDYEESRPPSVGIAQHEHQWERYTELRQELLAVRTDLLVYAQALAQIANVSSLVIDGLEVPSQETTIHNAK
jgi:transcriptional regulator with XRE-family HTH domain